MKKKIGIVLLIGILVGSCITSFAGKFKADYELRYTTTMTQNVSVYVDPYTGVNYLLFLPSHRADSGAGICPRYNTEGELFITDIGQND